MTAEGAPPVSQLFHALVTGLKRNGPAVNLKSRPLPAGASNAAH